jgi:hypothetical protein
MLAARPAVATGPRSSCRPSARAVET